MIDQRDYEAVTKRTAAGLDPETKPLYLQLGLISELGEVAALHKRQIRDGATVQREKLRAELGDCLWYATQIALLDNRSLEWEQTAGNLVIALIYFFDFHPSDVPSANADKVLKRLRTGTIQGKGDDREKHA